MRPCRDLPGASVGNKPPVKATDLGSVPGLGRPPGGRHGNPPQYSCLEHPTDRGAWRAAVPGVAESRTGPRTWRRRQNAGRNPAPPRNPGQQRGHSNACLPPACISLCVEGTWRERCRLGRCEGAQQGCGWRAGRGLGVGRARDGAPPGLLARVSGRVWKLRPQLCRTQPGCCGNGREAGTGASTAAWHPVKRSTLRFSGPSWANTFQQRSHENSVGSSARPGIWARLIPAARCLA